eukprot:CAMPEP_0169461156 /NCGR_PEP_ID=MMETSP1042-20121227/18876_1 /TAXON_ID=464988 /ORGANISM="Hemiselmis andersenii, Strain CCMP1180" /LENGTH=251 /DNA_ID=CAMNT_0009573707 /DNA_START=681 /DNA_END=1432 /DNA_ORIENTATION=-
MPRLPGTPGEAPEKAHLGRLVRVVAALLEPPPAPLPPASLSPRPQASAPAPPPPSTSTAPPPRIGTAESACTSGSDIVQVLLSTPFPFSLPHLRAASGCASSTCCLRPPSPGTGAPTPSHPADRLSTSESAAWRLKMGANSAPNVGSRSRSDMAAPPRSSAPASEAPPHLLLCILCPPPLLLPAPGRVKAAPPPPHLCCRCLSSFSLPKPGESSSHPRTPAPHVPLPHPDSQQQLGWVDRADRAAPQRQRS